MTRWFGARILWHHFTILISYFTLKHWQGTACKRWLRHWTTSSSSLIVWCWIKCFKLMRRDERVVRKVVPSPENSSQTTNACIQYRVNSIHLIYGCARLKNSANRLWIRCRHTKIDHFKMPKSFTLIYIKTLQRAEAETRNGKNWYDGDKTRCEEWNTKRIVCDGKFMYRG